MQPGGGPVPRPSIPTKGREMLLAQSFQDTLSDAVSDVATFIPKLVGFLLILLIGWVIAKVLAKAVGAILERVGFDRAVERGGVKKALAKTPYDASDFLAKLVYSIVLLFTLQMAFGVFGPNPISDLLESVIRFLPKVIVAVVILVIAAAIAAVVRELIDAALGGLDYGMTLANIAGGAILVIGVFAALDQLEIASDIVNGLFYALLAILVGVAVVAIGGGGIVPMRQRWETALSRYDTEKEKVGNELEGASDRIEQRVDSRRRQMDPDAANAAEPGASQAPQRPPSPPVRPSRDR